jgi:predicted outer membrane repeat protein
MVDDIANRLTGLASIITLQMSAVAGMRVQLRTCAARFIATVAMFTFALMFGATARAATITVDSAADPGSPGICALRDAITAANTKTTTNGCAAGTGNDTIQFSITGEVALVSTLPRVTDDRLTIDGITIDGGSTVQIMSVASGATVNLYDVTFVNGAHGPGGAILNYGTLSITNGTFSNNGTHYPSTTYHGGAVANRGTLTVTNSLFSGNSARYGGAIDNSGTLAVTNCTFFGNTDYFGTPRENAGAGIYNDGGTVAISNSTFSGNYTVGYGGGIENLSGTMTVTNSTFFGNLAPYRNTGEGGGIYNNYNATLIVTNSTFSGNHSNMDGGAITSYGPVTVTNSTFSGNLARRGGAVYGNGEVAVTNSTFSGNFSYLYGNAITGVTVKSTILADTFDKDIFHPNGHKKVANCAAYITDAGYNISDDQSCGFSATGSLNGTNPQLDPTGLSNNGGPTLTISLLAGSPAIDAIPVADCTDQASPPNPITTDQRGFPRPDNGENACDIGAYEFQDAR